MFSMCPRFSMKKSRSCLHVRVRTNNSEMDVVRVVMYTAISMRRIPILRYFTLLLVGNGWAKTNFFSEKDSLNHFTLHISFLKNFVRTVLLQFIKKLFLQQLGMQHLYRDYALELTTLEMNISISLRLGSLKIESCIFIRLYTYIQIIC